MSVIGVLTHHPVRIESLKQALQLKGVGKKTAQKIEEIVETGDLRRIGYEMQGGNVVAMKLFQGIYGVGAQTATKWVASGCRTLEDLTSEKGGVKLSAAQEIGVRFYEGKIVQVIQMSLTCQFRHQLPHAQG